ALGVVTIYLHLKNRNTLYTLLPMIFVLIITLWAMFENLLRYFERKDYVLIVLSVIIIISTFILLFTGIKAMIQKIGR
ncbi:MAG: hypothetical protein ACP5E3_08960, partial [Bacteroidales bacterium]